MNIRLVYLSLVLSKSHDTGKVLSELVITLESGVTVNSEHILLKTVHCLMVTLS
jgi:hypothetical protein